MTSRFGNILVPGPDRLTWILNNLSSKVIKVKMQKDLERRKCSMCDTQDRFHDLFAVNYYFKSILFIYLFTYYLFIY